LVEEKNGLNMIYTVKCKNCGRRFEAWAKVADRHNIYCECGGRTEIIITPPHIIPDLEPEWDDGLGYYVKSRQHKRELLKKHNLRQL